MPDETGTITAGGANVATPGPTPVLPGAAIQGSINLGQTTGADSAAPSPQAPPTPPTQHPTFFRRLLFTLGQGLIEGTKAGLQAQMSPQGPSQAASIAINAPQAKREQLTTNQMNDMTVAMTQLKLHQMHMMVAQEDEGIQNAAYNKSRDTLSEFVDKGRVDVLATGDLASVQSEFARRQADAKQSDKGLLPLQIFAAAGSDAKNPTYSLVMMSKGKLTEDLADETWGASDFSDDPQTQKDFKAAGIGEFKYKGAPAGTDQQGALAVRLRAYQNWWTKSTNQLGQWKRTQLQETGRNKRAVLAADVRMKQTDLNNITRRAIADKKAADQAGDKLKIAALGKLVSAAKAFGDAQGKIGNKAWDSLGQGETKELTTKRAALDAAKKEYDALFITIPERGAPAPQTPLIPKGTIATPQIVHDWALKHGQTDPKQIVSGMKAEGYAFPTKKSGGAQ